MGDKSPKARERAKKQASASKDRKKSAGAAQPAPPVPPGKKGK